MSTSLSRYVNVTSGVGGASQAQNRDLITRIFSENPLIPTNSFLEFTDLPSVGLYFGTSSDEYLRAQYYFSFISKNITQPQKLSFASFVSANVAPMIFGAKSSALALLQAVTAGTLTLTMGSYTANITGLNFSSAVSFANVATALQTAIQAETGGSTQFTAATVAYDSTTGGFNLVGGAEVAAVISVASSGINDVAPLINWDDVGVWPTNSIFSYGALAQTITETLANSAAASDNFASWCFIPVLDTAQITEGATWNDSNNVAFMYLTPVQLSNAAAVSAAIANYEGCAMTLAPVLSLAEYPEMLPGMILAATNYNAINSAQNYMYQQSALTPSVSTDSDANFYDALNVNYYGQTQTAGNKLAFYQRGVLTGLATDPALMNTYANEIWLRDYATTALINLLLILPRISANATGVAQILGSLQAVIAQAIFNGTISSNAFLTAAQQAFITGITGDPLAWTQVQSLGYWIGCTINPIPNVTPTQYQAEYLLVYKQDNVINKIVGTHALI